ncbi:formate--tetrahydrofolate ligase [Candidatus Endobugula sertula]|uniref:Formate--tetrahydrofolate ligase n=1 Tax=Candidatus Endobugula sertula TaxID=62101 RepID=A0A1D2QMF7_9GAMM|nr:formate--tetrahydrofolate ligase [Candidatus Endobugula sertula]
MKTDIEIAHASKMRPISEVAQKIGIPVDALFQFGPHKAKIVTHKLSNNGNQGKLILVTAISPTPAGEGKTTTTIGLGDALNRIGKKTVMALREPSLGPVFGMKGGAAGGGYSQVVPMEDINLHFTGDFHAIGVAHNLLSALIDNHIHWGNSLNIDPRRIQWKRVMDMNDRALRQAAIALGGPGNGLPREDGFDITVASEVMAIFCLSESLEDLENRLGNIIVADTFDMKPVTARELGASGAMTVLLREAFNPNIVQTLENNPVLIHGGPFANIAHGCNSIVATKTALSMADYVVTEAGFGADLGAEKFFDIKCRKAGLAPSVAVIVATVRALKMHGGVAKDQLKGENVEAVKKGCKNLLRHIRNVKSFGVPAVVCINHFSSDTDAEIEVIKCVVADVGSEAFLCKHWANGGAGAKELAVRVAEIADSNISQFAPLYDSQLPLIEKIKTIATQLYGSDEVIADSKVRQKMEDLQEAGYGHFPVCMAKTQYSFSTDPNLMGAPSSHTLPIRDVRLSAGAEFLVVICGDIMTMPGLPRVPSANNIRINEEGVVEGLF